MYEWLLRAAALQPIALPPSIRNGAPVTYDESSLARNSAAFAISSGSPLRRRPLLSHTAVFISVRATVACSSGVSMIPGQMQFTRIFQGAYSRAATCVRLTTAALDAQYGANPTTASKAACDAVLRARGGTGPRQNAAWLWMLEQVDSKHRTAGVGNLREWAVEAWFAAWGV